VAARKVLLIDDEKEFVEVTKVLLEANGFEVVTAYDGQSGTQQALAEKPDVVVLDVMMETRTAGFDVARRLRANDETKGIPIIMLTAVNQEVPWRFEPDDIWLPVDVFLDKPVSPERLLAEARKATG